MLTTTKLVSDRVLVQGDDSFGNTGRCTLDSSEWEGVKRQTSFSQAEEDFDEAVRQFFAPIEAAQDKLQQVTSKPAPDAASYVVLSEPVAGVAAQPGNLIKLGHDSIVLRLLEQGAVDRLVWVDDCNLEVLEAAGPTPAGAGASGGNVSEPTVAAEGPGQPF